MMCICTIQKFGDLKEINTFIQWRCIKLIKCDSKDISNVTKDFYFKSILFFATFYSSKWKITQCIYKNKQHNIFNAD